MLVSATRFAFSFASLVAIAAATPCRAFDYTWTGGSGEWRNPLKWNPNVGFPGSNPGDTAKLLGIGADANLTGSINIATLQLGSSTALNIIGNPTFGNASLTATLQGGSPSELTLTSTGGAFDSSMTFGSAGNGFLSNVGQIRILPGTGGARSLNAQDVTNEGNIIVQANAFIGKPTAGVFQNGNLGSLGSLQVSPGTKLDTNQYMQVGNATTLLSGTLNVQSGLVGFSGGKLIGDGTFADGITVSQTKIQPLGLIVPQGYVGTASLSVQGNVSLGNNTQLDILLGSGGVGSRLAVQGNLSLAGANTALTLSGGDAGASYIVATYTGSLTDTFDGVTPGYSVSYATPGQIRVTVAPEPMSLSLLAGLAVMGVRTRRPANRTSSR